MLAGFGARRNSASPRWLSLAVLAIDLVLVLRAVGGHSAGAAVAPNGTWLAQIDWPWIPQLGIRLHLGLDGLSLLLILLTLGLGIVSVIASWSEITERVGFFHFNLMLTLAGVIGVFLALDLFPVLLLLGIDAGSYVFPDRRLGARAADLRGDQVLPVHPGKRVADVRRHPVARLHQLPPERGF